MTFNPQSQIIEEIESWGLKNGPKIVEAFAHEGDWAAWAQVELALHFNTFGNATASRNQKPGSSGITVDIFLDITNNKNVAMDLICETLPPGTGAKGEADVWQRIQAAYQEMKNLDTETMRPVAMGLVVSNIARDNARYNLCDKSLFAATPIYKPKSGGQVTLFSRWI